MIRRDVICLGSLLLIAAQLWLNLSHFPSRGGRAQAVPQQPQPREAPPPPPRKPAAEAADPMPRVVATNGSLCSAAPWSLAHVRARCTVGPLRHYDGYVPIGSSWNAIPQIRRHLGGAGYGDHQQPSRSALSSLYGGGRSAAAAAQLAAASVLVVPNYWKPRAADWREWRLRPSQRINRMWGMECVSKKRRLMRTLQAHYGVGGGDLAPASYAWGELLARDDWRARVGGASHWMVKTTAHRGQGLRLASSAEILAEPQERSLSSMLWQPDAVLQQYVASPLLVNGRKLSLRLYSLVTCAAPLRVYLYREGFALFASDEYDASSLDRYAFVTNAFVNRKRSSEDADALAAAAGGTARDHEAAGSLGLALPPAVQRWRLSQLESFLKAQVVTPLPMPMQRIPP